MEGETTHNKLEARAKALSLYKLTKELSLITILDRSIRRKIALTLLWNRRWISKLAKMKWNTSKVIIWRWKPRDKRNKSEHQVLDLIHHSLEFRFLDIQQLVIQVCNKLPAYKTTTIVAPIKEGMTQLSIKDRARLISSCRVHKIKLRAWWNKKATPTVTPKKKARKSWTSL